MRIENAFVASLAVFLTSTLSAQSPAKQDIEISTFYLNSTDGKAEAETESILMSDSTRVRSGGTAPGIIRYSLAKDDWYFTGDFYNIFVGGGLWGGISVYNNGWGLNTEFSFNHSKSESSFRDKAGSGSSSSGSSSYNSTQMAFGPSYSFISDDFRFETAIRYVLHKGSSSPFLDGYYDDMKLKGSDLKIKLAKFQSITESVSWGVGLDFQYLLSGKAELSQDYSVAPAEITVDDISYVSTMLYPVKLQIKF